MKSELHKIVMITGATAGIGKETAKIFAKNGYDIIITGRRADRLKEIEERLERKYAIDIHTLEFDVRDKEATKSALLKLKGKWKNIDILINNAGLAVGFDEFHKANIDDWEIMIDTNIKGLLYVSRMVAPHMVKKGTGHIINVCSTAGHEAYPKGNVYCATKFAVDALTKSMRMDLFNKGIKVGQISPGAVEETEFSLVRFKGDEQKAKIYDEFVPLTSSDVAKVIYFMSSQPKHVNIHDIILTGNQQASATMIDKSGRKK